MQFRQVHLNSLKVVLQFRHIPSKLLKSSDAVSASGRQTFRRQLNVYAEKNESIDFRYAKGVFLLLTG